MGDVFLFVCFPLAHQLKAIPNIFAYAETTLPTYPHVPGCGCEMRHLLNFSASALCGFRLLIEFQNILRLPTLTYTPKMNNSSLLVECSPAGGTVEADPDIAGTGVRADILRKWLEYVN